MAYINDGRVSLRLDKKDLSVLSTEAENKGISLSALVRIILKEYLEEKNG